MTPDQIRRSAGYAGLAAAVIGIPSDLYHFTMGSRTAAAAAQGLDFRLHIIGLLTAFVLVLLALAGLVLAQSGRGGRRGAVGAAAALVGTPLVIADLAKEGFSVPLAPEQLGDPTGSTLFVVVFSFVLLGVGWLLTARALRRAGVVSGPAAALLSVGALLAVPPIPGAYVTLLLGIAVCTAPLRRTPAPVGESRVTVPA